MQPDIGKALVADMAERGRDAVEERLAANEAMIGKQVGAKGEMLARAEADLEMQRAVVAEQALRGDFALGRTEIAGSRVSTSSACPLRSLCPLDRP